jgi:hypothetical protein
LFFKNTVRCIPDPAAGAALLRRSGREAARHEGVPDPEPARSSPDLWRHQQDLEEMRKITIWNQFDKRKSVDVLRSVMLAVPSIKKEWNPV